LTNGKGDQRVVVAPAELDLDTRVAFRREAVETLDAMAAAAAILVIDLSATRSVDSAGLGALMLIQRRAAERRITVRLRGLSEDLRFLLALTRLEDLFEVETGLYA